MTRTSLAQILVAAVISFGAAGCLTLTVPQCNPPAAASTRPATTPSTGTAGVAARPNTSPTQATRSAGATPAPGSTARPPADPSLAATVPPDPTPTAVAPTAPVGQAPAPPTSATGTSPNSPHPTGWITQHGLQVKSAGGVAKATMAGGISCATCHTTGQAADGTVARSPVATYTCFSCHNGPNG